MYSLSCQHVFVSEHPADGGTQVWCLAVSSGGEFVITGSHDRSLRRWERTEEPFFVEEERERRLESLFEADLEVPVLPLLWPPHAGSVCGQLHVYGQQSAGLCLLRGSSAGVPEVPFSVSHPD